MFLVTSRLADPIRSGFIQSLARPGGNVTGMSALAADMAGKRLELLKETDDLRDPRIC
jgi:putative tryptophan/tyrosine transport system substrate-binding protein